uniref:Uncharacterized protein n=1 Tax=Anguilla anguilla TaxID=7936 RepID=A0A0E9PHV1_ANGAN
MGYVRYPVRPLVPAPLRCSGVRGWVM